MRVAAGAGQDGVGDQVDRIGGPRVLGLLVGVVVGHPGAGVEDDVLEDRAETLSRGVDLRLRFLVDPDCLRVAAAFKVEDPPVAPAMLVVADEPAGWLGRERRLARAAQAEEKRDV